jgi:sialidase-1
MKRTNLALFILMLLFGIINTSCKKEIQVNGLQSSVFSLEAQCDTLLSSLSQSNSTILTLKASISAFTTNQQSLRVKIDSIENQIGTLLSGITTLKSQATGTYQKVVAINTQSANTAAINNQVSIQDKQLTSLNQQYASVLSQLQITEMSIEGIVLPRSYIALANNSNVANYAGDIIVCPGYYLSVYTHFYRSSSDIAPTFIAGRKSTDTTGSVWGSEFTVSANIGKLNVSSVSLYRVNSTTINCYFLVKNSTADTRLYLSVSPDNGTTWSAAKQVIYEGAYDIFMNAAIHTVNNGRMIIPVASDPVFRAGFVFSDHCLYSDDGGATWTKSTSITPPVTGGGLEPKIVQLSGDTCLMNMRTYTGFQYFSISTDNCKTWGVPYQSTLVSSFSPAEIVNVSGKLIAIHNNNPSFRNPMSISESLDKGATWTHIKDIETGSTSVYGWSYPSVTVSNGYLLISYYETINEPVGVEIYNLKFTKVEISTLSL